MTTPQNITPNDIALGVTQLGSVRQIFTQAEQGGIPAEAVGPAATSLIQALDDLLTVVDGVSLPAAPLDQAVGIVRDVRRQLVEVRDNAGALTGDTVVRVARTLGARIEEAMRLSLPYTDGGNPQNSPHRQVDFGGGVTFRSQTPAPAQDENPLSWLGQTDPTPPRAQDTPQQLGDMLREAVERARGRQAPTQAEQTGATFNPMSVGTPPRQPAQPETPAQGSAGPTLTEGSTCYILDGGLPRPATVQLLGGTLFVVPTSD